MFAKSGLLFYFHGENALVYLLCPAILVALFALILNQIAGRTASSTGDEMNPLSLDLDDDDDTASKPH